MPTIQILLMAALVLLSPNGAAAKNDVLAESPWVRLLPPSLKTTGAYVKLKNPSLQNVKIIKASCEVSERVELHSHVMEAGIARMSQIKEIHLPSGKEVHLEPGGLHLMLIGLKRPLIEGETLPIQLELNNGDAIHLSAVVRKNPLNNHHHQGGEHH